MHHSATAINDAGRVAGWTLPPNWGGTTRAAFWDAGGTRTDHGSVSGKLGRAEGISPQGYVVGASSFTGPASRAFGYYGPPPLPGMLAVMLPPGSSTARAMNGVQRLVGWRTGMNGSVMIAYTFLSPERPLLCKPTVCDQDTATGGKQRTGRPQGRPVR
jgi:uncharacterized membrane protein